MEQNQIDSPLKKETQLSDTEIKFRLNDLSLYRHFFDLSLDMLCIAGKDGFFKLVNPAFKTLGYSRAELLSKEFIEFVHPDDIAATRLEVEKLTKGNPTIHFENRYRCKDESYKWLAWTAMPQKNMGLFFAIARDMTEAKHLTEVLKKNEADLKQVALELHKAVQLRDEMTGFIVHELKNPLTVLKLRTQLMQNMLPDEPHLNEFKKLLANLAPPITQLDSIATTFVQLSKHVAELDPPIQQMNSIIADLLEIIKIDTLGLKLEIQEVDLVYLVKQVIKIQLPLAEEKSLALKVEIADDCRIVLCDSQRTIQVLTNLISNAIKFTDTGGSITITARKTDQHIEVKVSDTGKGIDEEDLPHVYDRFWQVRDTAHLGTGLGLSIVKSIVEAQKGKTWVKSEVGLGTSFHFTLPAIKN